MNTKLSLVVCFLLLGVASCTKEKNNGYQSEGKILGPDLRMCACCGGWYIQIDNVTYEFDTLPANSTVDLQKDTFPIMVKLDWQLSDKGACPDSRINIIRIVKE
jgi:hypothetical protein